MASQPNPRAYLTSTDLLAKLEELTNQVVYWQKECKLKDQRIRELSVDNDEMRQRLEKWSDVAAEMQHELDEEML